MALMLAGVVFVLAPSSACTGRSRRAVNDGRRGARLHCEAP